MRIQWLAKHGGRSMAWVLVHPLPALIVNIARRYFGPGVGYEAMAGPPVYPSILTGWVKSPKSR